MVEWFLGNFVYGKLYCLCEFVDGYVFMFMSYFDDKSVFFVWRIYLWICVDCMY